MNFYAANLSPALRPSLESGLRTRARVQREALADGEMALRWAAAGMECARDQFRRVKGYRQLPELARRLQAATAEQLHDDTFDLAVTA